MAASPGNSREPSPALPGTRSVLRAFRERLRQEKPGGPGGAAHTEVGPKTRARGARREARPRGLRWVQFELRSWTQLQVTHRFWDFAISGDRSPHFSAHCRPLLPVKGSKSTTESCVLARQCAQSRVPSSNHQTKSTAAFWAKLSSKS